MDWICWRCILRRPGRLRNSSRWALCRAEPALRIARRQFSKNTFVQADKLITRDLHVRRDSTLISKSRSRRRYVTSSSDLGQALATEQERNSIDVLSKVSIRDYLEKSQSQYDKVVSVLPLPFESEFVAGEAGSMRISESEGRTHIEDLASRVSDIDAQDDENIFDSASVHSPLPGDIVVVENAAVKDGGELAVLTQRFDEIHQFLTIRGACVHQRIRAVQYKTGMNVQQDHLDRVIPFLPRSHEEVLDFHRQRKLMGVEIPREASSNLLQSMKRLQDESDEIYRLNAATLDNAHGLLAHETEIRHGTLEQLAGQLMNYSAKVHKSVSLLAVRRALTVRNTGFRTDRRSHSQTLLFSIQPKSEVRRARDVAQWTREYQDQSARGVCAVDSPSAGFIKIQEFVDKARDLILKSRSIRTRRSAWISTCHHKEQNSQPPWHLTLTPSSTFSAADQAIISFIESTCKAPDQGPAQKHEPLVSTIVRATGMYDDAESAKNCAPGEFEIDPLRHFQFLQEIGVLKPFENKALNDPHLLLPGLGLSRPVDHFYKALNSIDEKLLFPDELADIRHDWGSLTVYCIDSSTTKVLDDGISVERVSGSQTDHWIRIHVANPTARIGKDHALARLAAHLSQTFYATDIHRSMLPPWVVERHCSLAADRAVLTISARINGIGDIIETDIRPGIIQNVIRLSPQRVQTICDEQALPPSPKIWVGATEPKSPQVSTEQKPANIDYGQVAEIKLLKSLAQILGARRFAARGVARLSPRYSLHLKYGGEACENVTGVSEIALPRGRSHWLSGDPAIGLQPARQSIDVIQPCANSASNIVEEMMLVAGQAAALWCVERNVPALYRASLGPLTEHNELMRRSSEAPNESDLVRFFDRHIQPRAAKTGSAPEHWLAAYSQLYGSSLTMTSPSPCCNIGLPVYMRVTTPLGRYIDLMNHWQIQSAIQEEHRRGKRFVHSGDENHLAFSREELNSTLPRLRAREIAVRGASKATTRHWFTLLMWRAYELGQGQGQFPNTLTLIILKLNHSTNEDVCLAVIQEWGVETILNMPREGLQPQVFPGDHWECRPKDIQPFQGQVKWEPIRLIHRDETSIASILGSLRK